MTNNINNTNNTLNITEKNLMETLPVFMKTPIKVIEKDSPKDFVLSKETIMGDEYNVCPKDWDSCKVNLDLFMQYVVYAENIVNFLGKESIERNLEGIYLRDIARTFAVSVNDGIPAYMKEEILVSKSYGTYTFTEYRGSYSRDIKKKGVKMLKPNSYQSSVVGKIIKKCVIEKYPFLEEFNSSFYAYNGGKTYEFYISINGGSLYVPLSALDNKDSSIIIERMKEYWGAYYSTNIPMRNKVLLVLDDPETKRLFDYIDGKAEYTPKQKEVNNDCEVKLRYTTYRYYLTMEVDKHLFAPIQFNSFDEAYKEFIETLYKFIEDFGVKKHVFYKELSFGHCVIEVEGSSIKRMIMRIDRYAIK